MAVSILRIENPETDIGLWYTGEGVKTDFIKTLRIGKSKDLPMEFDPSFLEGGRWISGCDSLQQMKEWFAPEDVDDLTAAGYSLYAFDVIKYRAVPGHVVFRREDITLDSRLDMALLT